MKNQFDQVLKGLPAKAAPGILTTFLLRAPRDFRGQHIVNLAHSDGLVITAVFVGNTWQRPPAACHCTGTLDPYEIPLDTMAWPLDICVRGLDIAVQIKNRAAEARNILFEIHGDNLEVL